MKTVVWIALLFATIINCDKPLSNEEIAKQVEFCRNHNLVPHLYATALTINVTRVQCQTD